MPVARPLSKSVAAPIFLHDCKACRFLGRINGRDLYFCPNGNDYLARFGSKGEEYTSLGNHTPSGSVYNLARKIMAAKVPPRVYRLIEK